MQFKATRPYHSHADYAMVKKIMDEFDRNETIESEIENKTVSRITIFNYH